MCRFVLYQGVPLTIASLVTEPANSIINQSVHSKESEEPLNGDGFGVAWWAPDLSHKPAVFRSVSPAWSNMNLLELARVTRSGTVMAHVRAATRGIPVTELNCHPFAAGPYAFMHNGDVARFGEIRRRVLADLSDDSFHAVKGSTDSEHLFGVFLDQVAKAGGTCVGASGGKVKAHPGKQVQAMAAALERTVEYITRLSKHAVNGGAKRDDAKPEEDEDCYLNIAVSDGDHSVACRYTTADEPSSLYVHTGRRYVCEGGLCRMVSPEKGHGAVIVSSEPLSDDPGWQKIPRNHMVVVSHERECEVREMQVAT
ncbi:MAG TPA: class II glutamine amidotransferase [Phycisphaerales bacterium]|nr:class II glutamine amidotransferase [Phycisphaerales bacterium]